MLDLFLEHSESIGRAATTLREYRRIVEKILRPELGKIKLKALDACHLDTLYAKLSKRGLKATSVRRVHALMSAALAQADKWEMVDRNVGRKATPPPVHDAEIGAPSPETVNALIYAAEASSEPMMATLLFPAALTGGRRGELCALRWSDVDWAEAELKIERSVYETAGGGWQEKSTKTHQSGTVSLVGVDEDGNMVEAGLELLRRHRATVDDLADRLGLVVPANAFMFSLSPIGSEPIRPDFVTKRFTALCRTMEKPALARLRRTNPKATRKDLDPAVGGIFISTS